MTPLRHALPSLLLALACPSFTFSQDEVKGPERWEKSIVGFEARDRETPPEKGTILFVGSSSIRMWELEKSWPDSPTVNNGFGGSTLADAIFHFERAIAPYQPSAIVIYAGDNDIAKDLPPEGVLGDFEALASLISVAHPDVPVVFIAIKPSIKRWSLWPTMEKANALVRKACEGNEQLHYADIAAPMLEDRDGPPAEKWFAPDGLHLSEWGYEQWTAVVKDVLREAGGNGA